MKYLSSQPFTIAVSSPRPKWITLDEYLEAGERRERAKQPHEYVNGGSMCLICGLDDKAKIHK